MHRQQKRSEQISFSVDEEHLKRLATVKEPIFPVQVSQPLLEGLKKAWVVECHQLHLLTGLGVCYLATVEEECMQVYGIYIIIYRCIIHAFTYLVQTRALHEASSSVPTADFLPIGFVVY